MEDFGEPDRIILRRIQAEVRLAEVAILDTLRATPVNEIIRPRQLIDEASQQLRRAGTPCSTAAISIAFWGLIEQDRLRLDNGLTVSFSG